MSLALADFANGLRARGLAHRFSFDEYEPEVDRYGGPAAMDIVERIFTADSTAVMRALSSLATQRRLGDAWHVAFVGIAHLLEALASTGAPLAVVTGIRECLGAELGAGKTYARTTSARFRRDRAELARLLLDARQPDMDPLLGRALREVVPEAQLASVLASIVHMHVNRVLRGAHRSQELLLCELLRRHYRSLRGRDGNHVIHGSNECRHVDESASEIEALAAAE
jgi:thiopeptide-type bacteriocin biosynthesis protein